MTSNRQKGSAYELEVQKILESQGYIVHRARQSYFKAGNKILTRSNDIFNCDIIAKKQDCPTRWVQVSTKARRAEKEKKLLSIGNIWNEMDSVELWLRYPGGVWKIYKFQKNKFKEHAKIERGKYFVLEMKKEKNKIK